MSELIERAKSKYGPKEITAILAVIGLIGSGYVYAFSAKTSLEKKLAGVEATLATTTEALQQSEHSNEELSQKLQAEKDRVDEFAQDLENFEDKIGILVKLSKTDPELLQKYSKVYFLNEHYVPPRVVTINEKYLQNPSDDEFIHAEVSSFFKRLLDKAREDGIELQIISAYRSFGEQASLKSGYTVYYGSGANTFSADQGYSEHQLGTTIDLTSKELGRNYSAIDTTKAYEWLKNNAHKYGFILSYPKGNAYYVYEPWHWRFVGRDLAGDLYKDGKNFYDLDQRNIDKYLAEMFD